MTGMMHSVIPWCPSCNVQIVIYNIKTALQYNTLSPYVCHSSPCRAMICFLACLKEFGEHAARQDVMHSRHPPFSFPFPLEADKVWDQKALKNCQLLCKPLSPRENFPA